MSFNDWLDKFIDEKDIDLDEQFEVKGTMTNFMQYSNVIQCLKNAPKHEQDAIKDVLVKIDFFNGDIKHYLRHLSKAIAI
jgi:hypothetical protein